MSDMLIALCWKLSITALCILMLTIGSCAMFESYLIATYDGDPLRLRCAIAAGNSNVAICTILADKNRLEK